MRELAEEHGYDLTASTAYSDSHTDLPFLEAVGNPVVVNPDRELRGIAEERDWPVREFGELAYPLGRRSSARRCSGSRSCSAPERPTGRRDGVRPSLTSGSRRSASPRPTPPR